MAYNSKRTAVGDREGVEMSGLRVRPGRIVGLAALTAALAASAWGLTRAAFDVGATATVSPERLSPGPMSAGGLPRPHPALGEAICVTGGEVDVLSAMATDPRLFVGADYQRAFALPNGRLLWLFQDAFVATPDGPRLLHHAGVLQSRNCLQAWVGTDDGTAVEPVLADLTEPEQRWFWPLGGGLGTDRDLHVFFAEMIERGEQYLSHVEPVATWLATIDIETMTVVSVRLAPNPSGELYGFSVAHDESYSYLYAHCHRQFGWDAFPFADPPVYTHDWDCAPRVTVGRVPAGRFDLAPEYWNGWTWVADPGRAVAVIPTAGRIVNPTQVISDQAGFVAVTKVGDWWGDRIVVDVAPDAQGPWRTVASYRVGAPCSTCTTYFASVVPSHPNDDSLLIGLSTNTWQGYVPGRYQPIYFRIDRP